MRGTLKKSFWQNCSASPQPKQVGECPAQISSNVSQAVRSAPPNTMPVLPVRHLRHTQPLQPQNQGGHKRDGAFARDVLRNQEERRRPACCGHLPQCSTFLRNITFLSPCSSWLVWRNFSVETCRGSLVLPRTSLQTLSFQPWQPKQGVVEAPCLEDASARLRQVRC